MMRKELIVSGGMATILSAVTGVVLYLNGGNLGDPTTNIPPPDTAAADEPPKSDTSVPGWPAGTATTTAANNATTPAANTAPAAAPQNPFRDASAPSANPWAKPAPNADDTKPPAADEVAKDTARPFGANEAAEAANQFSSRFKNNVAATENATKTAEKKPDDTIPSAGPELTLLSANPNMQPSAIATTPASTTTSPSSSAPPSAVSENRNPIFGTPISSAPAATQPTTPAATQPAVPSAAPPGNAYASGSTRTPTSDDLQWRPQDLSTSPPRAADVSENPLRSAASAPQTMTLPTLPRRDMPGAKADIAKNEATPQTPPRQPVQVATVIPVSTPPRVVPIPGGTRTQELGRVYIVEDGDSLTDIARRELGNGNRAAEIQALNREVLGNTAFLRPGLELILPR